MIIIKAKRSMAYLNNQRLFTRPAILKKGLTSTQTDVNIKEQFEFNFNNGGQSCS